MPHTRILPWGPSAHLLRPGVALLVAGVLLLVPCCPLTGLQVDIKVPLLALLPLPVGLLLAAALHVGIVGRLLLLAATLALPIALPLLLLLRVLARRRPRLLLLLLLLLLLALLGLLLQQLLLKVLWPQAGRQAGRQAGELWAGPSRIRQDGSCAPGYGRQGKVCARDRSLCAPPLPRPLTATSSRNCLSSGGSSLG